MLEGKRQIWPWGVSKLIPWHSLLGNICLLLWLHPHELWTCSTCRWAGQEAPFPELTAQNKVALWLKLLWAAGALGLLLLLCQHVPCASCFSVTSPGTGWWHFGDKPPGKGGREDVMGILWALRSMVSSCYCPDLPQMCPSPALQLISSIRDWSLQWIELHPEKKPVKSGNGQLHTWISATQ